MPELPEVETTRRGIAPHIEGKTIASATVRNGNLRWPVVADFADLVQAQQITTVDRRSKYLLLGCSDGTIILHLGMSGSLRVLPEMQPAQKHDHIDLLFADGTCLRYCDPRRFGSMFWTDSDPLQHKLLTGLGPEPLDPDWHGEDLWRKLQRSSRAVKLLLMDAKVVVGVGNIYANESLFQSGIHPLQAANSISQSQADSLVAAIKQVIAKAIAAGGTTLRDFIGGDGKPGYFQQQLLVYGREGATCHCGTTIQKMVIGQRASYFCPQCQPLPVRQ